MEQLNYNSIQKLERILRKRVSLLQTVRRKEFVLRLACTGKNTLAIAGDEWDRDPWSLAVKNGVIDLKTGVLRPGRPEDYNRTIAPTSFLGLNYPAPMWEQAMSQIFSDNPEIVAYLQRLLGYGITGLTNHHMLVVFYGPHGRNGKGTIVEASRIVLGDVVLKTRSEVLMKSKYPPGRGSADADTADFQGKRIIWASETGDGQSLDTARVKELCGGDSLNARRPYAKRAITFTPTHLLLLITNNRPKVPADDHALWERLHLIPFNMRFVDHPVKPNERPADHDLLEKLRQEAPGILAWLVRGCLAWQKQGLCPPPSVKAATGEYRSDEDEISQFTEGEYFQGLGGAEIRTSVLYAAFVQWAKDTGLDGPPVSIKRFSMRLVDMGHERDNTGRHTIFRLKQFREAES